MSYLRVSLSITDCGYELKIDLRLTLNANLSGYFSKRRLRRVLFPEPLGPEITIGLLSGSLIGAGASAGGDIFEVYKRYVPVKFLGWNAPELQYDPEGGDLAETCRVMKLRRMQDELMDMYE